MYLNRGMVFEEWDNKGLLELHEEVPVDRERLTMVVIIERIVAETFFRRNVGIGSGSHCLLGEACKSLAISSIDAGGNDDNTLGGRGGLK